MSNGWFRLYAEFMHDPKVQMMSETYQRRLIMLLCARCNGSETLQDSEVTFLLRISDEDWQATKADFINRNFIDSGNKLLNWDKRQFRSDSSTERVREHREKQKQQCNVSVTPQNRYRTDTEQIQKEEGISATSAKFAPPFADLQKIWNEVLKDSLPEIRGFNEKRKTALRGRWVDELGRDLGVWRDFCEKIAQTPFLLGENDRGWKATIDWALKPSSISKTLEGSYEKAEKQNTETAWMKKYE